MTQTVEQISRGEANPFTVVNATSSPYSASDGEVIIADVGEVQLPTPVSDGVVIVKGTGSSVNITTTSGLLNGSNSGFIPSSEYRPVALVSDGSNWFVRDAS